jgi:hypothetical protein
MLPYMYSGIDVISLYIVTNCLFYYPKTATQNSNLKIPIGVFAITVLAS